MGVLTGLTAAKIGQLTAAQIEALTTSDIAGMTTVQIPGLTATQMALFTGTQLGAFSKTQIPYLTTAALGGLTPTQMGLLTAAQVASFSATQIAVLSVAQVQALTTADIAALTTTQAKALTTAQVAALKTTQFTSLSAADIAVLSTTQVKALTAGQLAVLTTAQLAAFTAADITALSPAQIASLNPADIASLSATQLKALTSSQVAALTPTELSHLTATQLGALTTAALAGLTAGQLGSLTTAQLAGLTTADIAALSVTQFGGLTAAQISALSAAQIGALTAAQVASLTAAQFNGLTAAQLGALSTTDIHSLSTARLAGMTGAQIASLTAAQINALSSTQLASLSINYNSMLAILQADANGGMTGAKFSALQALVGKFNVSGGITVSSYVQQISDDVVLGNAANATWTGGAAKSVALGNMTASSSQTQVSELIGKWFLGTDLPSSSVSMSGVPNFTVSYTAVSNPLFGSGGPKMTDINQGYLGDCFLLAPLAEMAYQDPSAIQSMIQSNGNNTYSVCFTVNGKADYVTVDNKLANGGNLFNYGANDWASLVEEAYTELQTAGELTGDSSGAGNSFTSIANGGYPELTLEELTGASAITDYDASGSSFASYVYNGATLAIQGKPNSITLASSSRGLSVSTVQAALVADLKAGDDVILSSYTDATDSKGKTTLVADHAMAVYGFDSSTQMLEVYNPWGTWTGGGQYWDTTFEVSLSTLLSDGDTISVATNGAAGGTSGTSSTKKTSATDASTASLFIASSASLTPLSDSASAVLGAVSQTASAFGLAAATV